MRYGEIPKKKHFLQESYLKKKIFQDLENIKLGLDRNLSDDLKLCLADKSSCRITGQYAKKIEDTRKQIENLKLPTYMHIKKVKNYPQSEEVSGRIEREVLPAVRNCVDLIEKAQKASKSF